MSHDINAQDPAFVQESQTPKSKKRKHREDGNDSRKKKKKQKQTDARETPPRTSISQNDQDMVSPMQREWEELGKEDNWESFGNRLLDGFKGVSESATPKKKKKKKKQHTADDSVSAYNKQTPQQSQEEDQAAADVDVRNYAMNRIREEEGEEVEEEEQQRQEMDPDAEGIDSPFIQTRLSQYIAVPPIALSTSTALSSIIAEHLSPLLLTYSHAAGGTILAFFDPSISTDPPSPDAEPTTQALALSAHEYGVSYVWLTATFLLFAPTRGQTLRGHLTACGEGFLSLTLYNLFSAVIRKDRIPRDWTWNPPSHAAVAGSQKKYKKEKWHMANNGIEDAPFSSSQATLVSSIEGDNGGDYSRPASQGIQTTSTVDPDELQDTGYFTRKDGQGNAHAKVQGFLAFRVVDTELVPGAKGEGWSQKIEGTLLSSEDDEEVEDKKRIEWEQQQHELRRKLDGRGGGSDSRKGSHVVMSGALGVSHDSSQSRSR
ncbi:MAG: hypothetical protein Q9227_007900 [Pyrenula ochraceoflavens]